MNAAAFVNSILHLKKIIYEKSDNHCTVRNLLRNYCKGKRFS